ncbi:hypothetical protein L916_09249 [Plasmopara halstedii]|uniref:Uncharacterized protein n=1 Tax=Plasmopara halstedii TaxID=4781 RepID=A0A0P1AFY4_PLAHL|nr:hypothetical protein L916_09249 [Plasmopara halstedii]CEG39822.1 hypothetical protein L916_09249 [Plasmopara halstedii]|eukprot:XP_024576191.1 hypothetical protein L916_09249 [Plasmopara halstedii]
MESLFVRSLALGTPTDNTFTLTSALRTTTDATFAVASGREGLIRVYAASCSVLLHEFASIHTRIYTLHYTSFSDSLVTLESDIKSDDDDGEDVETFLCVYHDWREREMVRGYSLPLGALESPTSNRKADCVAVCSFTGRVVVAMGTVLNMWQCSHGFFEHVMELKVDMAQQHAFFQVEFVAIHGVYIAFASPTEVRVMEIHVQSRNENNEALQVDTGLDKTETLEEWSSIREDIDDVPVDSADCVNISSSEDLSMFVEVPVSCSVYNTVEAETRREQEEQRIFDEQEQIPMVLGRNEAQQEVWNLAGLVKSQDIRTNQAMSYYIGEDDVSVLLQRFLPPNHSIRSIKFLPETIDNRLCVETRSYTRLLVATDEHAFLYYFLSEQVDSTRKKMTKKVFGKGERTRSRGMHKPIKVARVFTGQRRDSFASVEMSDDENDSEAEISAESGRVVMHYHFTCAVTSITANSSFLFVATLSGLQVWSIWSPCHYVAASRALSKSLVPQPSQPQLLCTQPIPYPVSQLAALDSYVVLLPQIQTPAFEKPIDMIRMASLAAAECLPDAEFEMRSPIDYEQDPSQRKIIILQQSPPSSIFSYVRQGLLSTKGEMMPFQIDLLLSLFSLYRYRADVGSDLLRLAASNGAVQNELKGAISDQKEMLALELETNLYDHLAGDCAAELAAMYMSKDHRNLERAALLFVASNISSVEVLQRLQSIVGTVDRSEVIQATGKYLEAFVFPPQNSLADIYSPQQPQDETSEDTKFTRIVLEHYGEYFPEQLSHLIVNSTLKWTLEDIVFALDKLNESSSNSVLVKTARLVLVLRANTFAAENWDTFTKSSGTSREDFIKQCSESSMLALVADLLKNHEDALIQVALKHPDLLVQEISPTIKRQPSGNRHCSSSKLTKALQKMAPLKYLDILERVFSIAISRQESVRSTLLFCLNSIGDAAMPTVMKFASSGSVDRYRLFEYFEHDQIFVLRFLVFVSQMFPMLEKLSEKEKIQDNEEDLHRAKATVAEALTRLCVKLSSYFQSSQNHDEEERVEARLCDLLEPIITEIAPYKLPHWVQDYLEKRCLPESPRLRKVLQYLFDYTIGLLHQKDLVCPQDLLMDYEDVGVKNIDQRLWKLENDLDALVVILTLPRVARTVDGLKLIAQRAGFKDLILSYSESYCVTLDDWRFLISILSSMSKNSTETASGNRLCGRSTLTSILNHLCLKLSPEELLQVLPDDGDIAMYMSTIEVSMQLEMPKDDRTLRFVQ